MSDDLRRKGRLVIANPIWAKGFTAVPNALIYASNLSAEAKYLYIVLLGYAWDKQQAWPGIRRLQDDTRWSVNVVRKYLRELEAGGLITIVHRPAPQTSLYLLHDLESVLLKGSESDPIPAWRDQKVTPVGSASDTEESLKKKTKDTHRLHDRLTLPGGEEPGPLTTDELLAARPPDIGMIDWREMIAHDTARAIRLARQQLQRLGRIPGQPDGSDGVAF